MKTHSVFARVLVLAVDAKTGSRCWPDEELNVRSVHPG